MADDEYGPEGVRVHEINKNAKPGDLRWCGVCACVEEFGGLPRGWRRAGAVRKGRTRTVKIPDMPASTTEET